MNDPQEPNALLLLGEIRGQLREMIHNLNNNSSKLDALASRVGAVEIITSKFETIEQLKVDVDALKRESAREEGAAGLWRSLMQSPALGWLVGAAVTAWAILTGRVNL